MKIVKGCRNAERNLGIIEVVCARVCLVKCGDAIMWRSLVPTLECVIVVFVH
jgi:hypothetical protein